MRHDVPGKGSLGVYTILLGSLPRGVRLQERRALRLALDASYRLYCTAVSTELLRSNVSAE